ncbi:MAG: 2-succinyl-5-enolpyruvyl-6-hydroxy-3-cyclohexene-1-carboxylic-acid synthase [Actinomycetes bacterium]
MNPSTALARVLVDELVRGGVREAVLSPGSRSAPLAFALHEADAAGRLRLHVRIDERSAGFLALGLAKSSGVAVPVVTTSGTAAVNLHPAVVEASYSGVPLVALTADRPPELRDVGANQTIDQVRLFGDAVRHFVDLPAPEDRPGQVASWRAAVARALASSHRGPVHVNVPLREPLVPHGDHSWVEPLDGRAGGGPWSRFERDRKHPVLLDAGPRTVVVAGDGADGRAARWVAEAASWPLLAEPTSGARSGPNALATYRLLLPHLGGDIERVVVFGRPTLSRPVARLLSRADVQIVAVRGRHALPDIGHRAAVVAPAVAPSWVQDAALRAEPDEWLGRWLEADAAARKVVGDLLAGDVTGQVIARTVADALPAGALLFVGSSAAIRDLDLADPWDDRLVAPAETATSEGRLVLANRGASGIDGTVSTAIGAALAHDGPAYALMGDLTFLHDSNGLVLGPHEPRPDLTIVVNNDDGGGIFGVLEQGAPEHADAFERVFGTPHGVDLAALCRATGTPYSRVATRADLRAALTPGHGIRVVEARTDRHARRDLDERLRDAVTQALQP